MSNNIFDAKGIAPVILLSILTGFGGAYVLQNFLAPPKYPPVSISIEPPEFVTPTIISGEDATNYIRNFVNNHPGRSRAINISSSMLYALKTEASYRTAEPRETGGWRVYFGNPDADPEDYKAIVVPMNSAYEVTARTDHDYIMTDIPYPVSNPCPDMCYGEIADYPPIYPY